MRKNLRLILAALLAVAVIAGFAVTAANNSDCTKVYRNDDQVSMGGRLFKTEVTKSFQEMQKGLGGRECIGENQAMLFNFGKEGQYGIWMKDMKFPIDVLWINDDKKIVAIEKNFTPETYPDNAINEKDKPASYVLEVKAGTADKLGLILGSPVSF
jgi:uncharacterized membrane protein (UPF0127 family)